MSCSQDHTGKPTDLLESGNAVKVPGTYVKTLTAGCIIPPTSLASHVQMISPNPLHVLDGGVKVANRKVFLHIPQDLPFTVAKVLYTSQR